MDRPENDFERRVRESEEALLRQTPVDRRPFLETWWYFLCVTAYPWASTLVLFHQWRVGEPVERHRFVGVAMLVIFLPVFVVGVRRRGREARRRAHERGKR